MGPESVLTVRDSDLKRRTPLAPKAVVGFAAHLDDISASRAQAEDVEHLLLTCKVHLWRRTHSQITHGPFTALSQAIKSANVRTDKSLAIHSFKCITLTVGPNLEY